MIRWVRPVAAAVVLAGALGVTAAPSRAQAHDPTVALDRTGTAAGEEMLVTGTSWPPSAILSVELCGHGGLGGTVDCDVANQRTAGVGPGGNFSVTLVAGKPPTPCPCVVKVTDTATAVSATAAIAVQGAFTVPIEGADAVAARKIEVSSMRITGGGGWTELFGAPSNRTLELTLVNTGPLAVEEPGLTVAWGRGDEPTGFVELPALAAMQPGETQELEIELPRGAVAFGSYAAVAEIQGIAEPSSTTVTTSTYPWGLFGLALLLLQLVLLRVRNRIRARVVARTSKEALALVDAVPALPAPPRTLRAAAGTELPPAKEQAHPDDPDSALQVIDLAALSRNGATVEPGLVRAGVATPAVREVLSDEIESLRSEARRALTRATDLSEALVAAAVARAEALYERAAFEDRAAAERHEEALALLEAARARAAELTHVAGTVAGETLRGAAAEREAAVRALASADAERAELLHAGRAAVDRVVEDLQRRADEIVARTEREAGPAPIPAHRLHHELDRRLASAVSQALGTITDADRQPVD